MQFFQYFKLNNPENNHTNIFPKDSFNTLIGDKKMPKKASVTGETILFFDKLYDSMNGVCPKDKKKSSRCALQEDSYHLSFMKEAKGKLSRMRFVDKTTHEPDTASVPSLQSFISIIDAYVTLWKKLKNFGFTEVNLRYAVHPLITLLSLPGKFFARFASFDRV